MATVHDTLAGGAQVSIDFNHYKVHDSEMYLAGQYFTVTAASTKEFMIVTGSEKVHAAFDVATSAQTLIKMYEGITTSSNGTSVTVYNMDRSSANTCAAVFFHTPTWSTNSEVLILSELSPVAAVGTTHLGTVKDGEWILNSSTKYLVQLTNQSGSTITSTLNMSFYEI